MKDGASGDDEGGGEYWRVKIDASGYDGET